MVSKVPESSRQERARIAIAAIWERGKNEILGRVTFLEASASDAARRSLSASQRLAAVREAHKLAGALGTFGIEKGSQVARELEEAFQKELTSNEAVARLGCLVASLRDLVAEAEGGNLTQQSTQQGDPLVLLVTEDKGLADSIVLEARSRGLQTTTSGDIDIARKALRESRPNVVVVDLALDQNSSHRLHVVQQLGTETSLPVIALTTSDSLVDRIEIARSGARGVLHRSLPPGLVVDAVTQLLDRLRVQQGKILAVDDDPLILQALEAVLKPEGIEVLTLMDPLDFWDALEQASPDLVVLDVDMPEVSGMELCHVVRSDPRWASLPVLFLTARADVQSVQEIFAVGADDYVTKPLVGPELVARIASRLERARLFKSMTETDPLTGVSNRRKSAQALAQYLKLSQRYGQPLSFSIIDLDHFKSINDRYGHATGDDVLRSMGHMLLQTFRGEDVVARWGGEEFVIGMYGSSRENGARRLSGVLEELSAETFQAANNETFTVTFSGGVAQCPGNGNDLASLYRAADGALYRAKVEGRARVLAAGTA